MNVFTRLLNNYIIKYMTKTNFYHEQIKLIKDKLYEIKKEVNGIFDKIKEIEDYMNEEYKKKQKEKCNIM